MLGSVVGSEVGVGSEVAVALRVGGGSTVAVRLGTGVWVKDLVAVGRRARLVAADVLVAAAVIVKGWLEARLMSAASLHAAINKHIASTIMLRFNCLRAVGIPTGISFVSY